LFWASILETIEAQCQNLCFDLELKTKDPIFILS